MTYLINCLKIYIVINFYYLKVLFSYYFPPYFLGKCVYKIDYFFSIDYVMALFPPSIIENLEKRQVKELIATNSPTKFNIVINHMNFFNNCILSEIYIFTLFEKV